MTTVVAHADCPDGVASALICRDALGKGVRVLFVQHGTASLRDLEAAPGMLFVDIAPPRERAGEFLAAGALVLDHHRTQKDVVEAFVARGLGVFADEAAEPGVSGALLAYRHVWLPRFSQRTDVEGYGEMFAVRQLAEVVGVRDTWLKDDARWEDACACAAALRFWPAERVLEAGIAGLDSILAIGPVLREKDRQRDERSIAEAFWFDVGHVRVMCFEGHWTSDIADRVEADLVVGWRYYVEETVQKLSLSLRSRRGFSAADLARRYGGGGHTQAAGFTVPVVGFADGDPYGAIHSLVSQHVLAGSA